MINPKTMNTNLSLRRRLGLEIARKITNTLVEQHPLKQLFWECTLRCNLHCRHCGSDCKKISGYADMPKEDFLRVLDNIALHTDPHHVFVVITGGEPLMREDLEECGKAIHDKGFPWGMVTNGLAMTPERFTALLKAGMHTATVSLDGFADEHNWMRGHPQSFDKAVRAIRMMTAIPGFVFDVVTCVNKHNYAQLNELKEFLIGIGLKQWRLFTVFPVGRAASDAELQLSGEEFRGMLDFIKQTRKEGRIRISYGCEGFLGNYEGDVRDHFFSCQAGITVGSVLIDGSISACPSIRADFHQGNIYKDEFMDVWENNYQPYRDRTWMKKGECATCKYFRYCRGNGMHLRDGQGELMVCHLKESSILNVKNHTVMRKKVSCFSTRVWAGFLALLGFASCTSNEDPEDIPLEYGTPTVGFQVQGVVTDEEGNPLEDIQVIVRRAYNNDYRSGDTIYTDNKGAFAAEKFVTTGFEPDEQKVYFNDEKKVFKSDSILLKDMKLEKIEEGSGWSHGTYQATTEVKLKKAEKEE